MRLKGFFLLAALGFFLAGALVPVRAASKVGLVPAHPNLKDKATFSSFRFEMSPGEEKKDEVAVVNLSEETLLVKLALEEKDSWLKIASGSVSLKPQERKNVSFTVKTPAEAKPGDHLFHLRADEAVVGVMVFVKGEVKKELEVTKISVNPKEGKLLAVLSVKNTGDLVVDSLALRVNVQNKWQLWGEKQTSFFWPIDKKILPGEEASFELISDRPLPFLGQFETSYELDFGEIKSAGLEGFTYANGIRLLSIIVTLLVFIAVLIISAKGFVKAVSGLIKAVGKKRRRGKRTWLWKKEDFAGLVNTKVEEKNEKAYAFEFNENTEYLVRKIIRQELRLFQDELLSEIAKKR